ncbi:MAG: hypothetical protein KIS76_10280 [Pyrinomonadaceae bacterium]|nr:hypothetical protein [Pyrinomonadaceae bacterium]
MENNRLLSILAAILFALVAIPAFNSSVMAQRPTKGKAKTVRSSIAVPTNWDYVYEKKKGYGFYVPSSSDVEFIKSGGLDTTVITTGDPTNLWVTVLAYKDKTLTKDDLLLDAIAFLEEMGEEVTPIGNLRAESDNYAVGDALTVAEDGSKGKVRILVGTDITDNYIMIVGSTPENFKANEKTIDLIWGSFEMWSGVY